MPAEITNGDFCASWFGDYEVEGSKGNTYTVSLHGTAAHCDCQGFKFRQDCKHLAEVMENACLWNCQWHNGNDHVKLHPQGISYDRFIPNSTCDNCDGPLVVVRIAV